jgi:hypothetical protein
MHSYKLNPMEQEPITTVYNNYKTSAYTHNKENLSLIPFNKNYPVNAEKTKIQPLISQVLSQAVNPKPKLENKPSIPVEIVKNDPDYGLVKIQPFSSSWLIDYPQIVEHLDSEHILHVKGLDKNGEGLTWHTEKFKTDMNPRLNPEARVHGAKTGGFQMKMGYFIIPEDKVNKITSISLSNDANKEVQIEDIGNGQRGYRFFVHPEAFDHFRALHSDPNIRYVSPENSEYIATPTSSYRSLAIRRIHADKNGNITPARDSIPFVVKLGVGGSILGSDRWLSTNEIERSVQSQQAFDTMDKENFNGELRGGHAASELFIFPETLGISLNNIDNYPPMEGDNKVAKPSGMLIREFPKAFLDGECRILSMAALISCERTKKKYADICQLSNKLEGFSQLPLIFQIMEATIRAGKAESAYDFIQKYLIKGYIDAIEAVTFHEGMPLEPHSQNLCMVLNNDLTPRGYIYRDHGGIWVDIASRGLQGKDLTPFHRENHDVNAIFKSRGAISKSYVTHYSWFYRYQVFVKTLNTLTELANDSLGRNMPPFPGAPYQIGSPKKLTERNLNVYLKERLQKNPTHNVAIKNLKKLSLTLEQNQKALQLLDTYYNEVINRHFDMEKVGIKSEDGALPSAEGGSGKEYEKTITNHKGFLGKHKATRIPEEAPQFSIGNTPQGFERDLLANAISSFDGQKIEDLNITKYVLIEQGVCFFDNAQQIVAFTPYATPQHKIDIEQKAYANNSRLKNVGA